MKKIVVASVLVLLVSNYMMPAQANPIAPECKDIPSCGVAGIIIGTEIISGVLYYVVQSGAGVIHKVRAKQKMPPAHRTVEPGRHKVGDKVYAPGLVSEKAACEQKARDYGAQTDGGEWVVVDYEAVGGGPERIDHHGNVEYMPIKFRCILQKVR